MDADPDKLVFLHIPKTAGTSFRALVEPQFEPGTFLHLDPPITREVHHRIHPLLPGMRALFGHLYFGIDANLGFRAEYITFLRDPVDRVVSWWKHQQTHAHSQYYDQIRNGLSLRALIHTDRDQQVNNLMTRIFIGTTLPGMLDGSVGVISEPELLDVALQNASERFVFVGFVEEFALSVNLLFERFGWTRPDSLPFLNRLVSCQADVDDETLELVRHYNRLDSLLYEKLRSRFQEVARRAPPSA
jgi:hypothetical protein